MSTTESFSTTEEYNTQRVVSSTFSRLGILFKCVYLISGLLFHICDFNGCLQRRPANPGKVPSSGSGSTIGSSIGATRKMSKKAGKNFDPKLGVNRNQVQSTLGLETTLRQRGQGF